ncbi:uncharacterized protein PRCAT00001058001 [Priceomyces carsonii]|uniref:uncharacterized protein n=1 Tax=Priceomyces carsonii TaxID=28549 RepID=UPI002ED87D2E|nr:unnamed protein product [Priceomyces carsonii]
MALQNEPDSPSLNEDIELQNFENIESRPVPKDNLMNEDNMAHSGPNLDLSPQETLNEGVERSNLSLRWKILGLIYFIWDGPLYPEDNPPKQIERLTKVEDFPTKLSSRIPKPLRTAFLGFYFIFWFGLWYSVLVPYLTIPPYLIADRDVEVITLSCQRNSDFWKGKNQACGLGGEACPSLKHEGDIVFRCPALCDRGSWTYSYIPVGDQDIKYRGFFIGGGDEISHKLQDTQVSNPYRSDSFPCGAAVHAGQVSPFFGGCARISYESGPQPSFPSTEGHYGVSDSIPFLSFFQSSFFFKKLNANSNDSFNYCHDPRLLILVLNIILGIPIVYLASGLVTFWSISIVGFWTICLATDPPRTVDPLYHEDFADLISVGLERFLPSCCVLYVLWKCSSKTTLSDPNHDSDFKPSPLHRLFLWYPLFWLGVLNNITFDRLPVDRLTLHDLSTQPGSLFAVGSIILTIVICAFIQAYKIWLSGRFRQYLMIYLIFVLSLILLASLPNLTLRIHHYILAMLLIPGCATRGRTALLFQGILLGLFLSGAARWGFASIVETANALRRDDPSGVILPPLITGYNSTGYLTWSVPSFATELQQKLNEKYDSVSILVNDVERFVGDDVGSVSLELLIDNSDDLRDYMDLALKHGSTDDDGNISMFLRIGRKIANTNYYSDFSKAAILKWPSGEFELPQLGIT